MPPAAAPRSRHPPRKKCGSIFGPAAGRNGNPVAQGLPDLSNARRQKNGDSPASHVRPRVTPARHQTPMIRGITFGNKIRVFYSHLDISGGLVGEFVDGIYGYDPQTSTELMSAMIRYAIAK